MRMAMMILAVFAAAFAGAQEASMPLDDAFARLAVYEFGQSRLPLTSIESAIHAAHGDPAAQRALAQRLTDLLAKGCPIDAKRFICRQLAVIGDASAVPVAASLLADPATADIGQRLLESIPGPEAAAALATALDALPDARKLGLIQVMGRRGDATSAPVLIPFLAHQEESLAAAAAAALGNIGGDAACAALGNALADARGARRAAVADACLQCAERLLEAGRAADAAAWYQRLSGVGEAGHVRAAALSGLILADPDQALARVSAALRDADPVLMQVAAGYVRDTRRLPGEAATKAFAEALEAATPGNQSILLSALADRGDPAAAGAAERIARDGDESVRVAAVKALGAIGDGASVALLLDLAANATGELRRAAREALVALPGGDVNGVLAENTRRGRQPLRVEAVRALADRNAADEKALLLRLASDKDDAVRREAIRGAQVTAAAEDVPAILDLLAAPRDPGDMPAIENAVIAVAQRALPEAQRVGLVLKRLEGARDKAVRLALLRVAGSLPAPETLAALRATLEDADADARLTALAALAAWPSQEPLDDLRAAVLTPKSDGERDRAFEGYVRQLRAALTLPMRDRVQRHEEAMTLARNAGEKRAVLAGLADAPALATLTLAEKAREDAEVAGEADNAIVRIAQAICGAYPDAARAAVQRYLSPDAPENLRAQAEAVIRAVDGFDGYLTAWEVAGPYFEDGKGALMLFLDTFPPESPDAAVPWRIMPMGLNPDAPWVIDLNRAIGGNDRVAFLRTVIRAPEAMPAVLEIGSNDGVKVWLNGEQIHALNVGRTLTPGEDVLDVTLRPGDNTLMMAVFQQGGDWNACARLRAPGGGPLPGITARIPE